MAPPGGHLVADGPLCPEHKLPVKIKNTENPLSDSFFSFECLGLEGNEGHIIKG